LSQQLIYRLACLGFDGTISAYGGKAALGNECKTKQIRVLLSPQLNAPQSDPALAAKL
jgi:hypothetical protein